ncbi:MAG TPA: amino acid ABC transporter substrate-binding protein [Acidimicrobiales bacterium]|nr:amino acid ABC transporter substrate-binding protein [Acidimicrobiales bacterium]
MNRKGRYLRALGVTSVALASLAMMATSSGASSSTIAKGKPVTIGISLSLSGDFSADGSAFKQGYQLWADTVNKTGGLLGHKVKLDIVSDASSPTQVVTNYQKLISLDHVNLTVGPFSSLLSLPAAKAVARYGYAMVEGAGGAPSVFQAGLTNLFDVSMPVKDSLVPFANWLAALPASTRPKTVAYVTTNDAFTEPQIPVAKAIISKAGIKTAYYSVFPAETTDYTPIADAVAAAKAQVVVLGSVDVPTVSAFMQAFEQAHYNPKVFIATGGPDQGTSFSSVVGIKNADGVMVPNAWYGSATTPGSQAMVAAYVKKYGGSASTISADVAEAYSVGQVINQAVVATKGFDNSKIIAYLHSGVTLTTVQGSVKFDKLGENNSATAFTFQWQGNNFVQVNPTSNSASKPVLFPKPVWGK